MKYINLTPHVINIRSTGLVLTVEPSGAVARVATEVVQVIPHGGFDLVVKRPGQITGLPEPDPDGMVTYIVSGMVAAATPRMDVVSPGDLIRDENGRPIGCRGLTKPVPA